MLKISHRINTISDLRNVPSENGIELDIRYHEDRLILQHDSFQQGEDFEEFLKYYSHQFIILNTKSEGMEEKILKLMSKYDIKNYFFLDLSLPYLIKYANKGIHKIAIRFSEYEPIEFVMNFAGKVDWVWVDCFNYLPLNEYNYTILKKHFKICLVSPELQGYPITHIDEFKKQTKNMEIDAVCTKYPNRWD